MNKYKSNYNALKDLPIVQKLLKKNEKLKKENASLKNLIYSLPEFRKDCNQGSCCNKSYKNVHIKKEPGIDAEIIDLTDTNHENITYSLVSDSSSHDNKVDSFGNYPIFDNIKTVSLTSHASDDDFTCTNCDETFSNNYCFLCDRNNICTNCDGSGGDYGKKNEWICSDCIHLQSQDIHDELNEPVIKIKTENDTSNNETQPDILVETIKLCENMDCVRYPPDWDFEEDTEENYEDGQQWVKCNKCDGYYNNDGIGDILFVQEEPHNQEAECDLCGKTEDIVQMKGCGQYLCGDGCDESGDDENP